MPVSPVPEPELSADVSVPSLFVLSEPVVPGNDPASAVLFGMTVVEVSVFVTVVSLMAPFGSGL